MKIIMTIAMLLNLGAPTHGGVSMYTKFTEWSQAVNNKFTTIDFTGYPDGTFITDQYASFGVTFLDGNDNIFLTASMVNDGAGIDGNSTTTLEFVQPMNAVALHYPGVVQIDLMFDNEVIYSSPDSPGGGTGFFYGLLSTFSFNRVVIDNPFAIEVAFDDLHFGIAAPPVLCPSFPAVTSYTVLYAPISMAIGDLNGDGHLDLATANLVSNDCSILLNTGAGTYAATTYYATDGIEPVSVAIGDLDGDGHPDLACANVYSNELSILFNTGEGAFAPAATYAVSDGPTFRGD